MPNNKNAFTRYRILDELLSDRHHQYSLNDLTVEMNRRLAEMEIPSVTRRCVEKDIAYLEETIAPIERISVSARNIAGKFFKKRCLRYPNPSFSIFKKELTDDEKYLMSQLLTMIGQFDGLPEFEALEDMRKDLGETYPEKIVLIDKNPLMNTNRIGEVFTAISHKVVIEMKYEKFVDIGNIRTYQISPIFLKEHNRRWFVFGVPYGKTGLVCFALDRIKELTLLPSYEYAEYTGDKEAYFEDIVGVTNFGDDKPVEHIVFWADTLQSCYVRTKPLHESQRQLKQEDAALREQYPSLKDAQGSFFSIDCKYNYELIRELSSCGESFIVLSPQSIQDEIERHAREMAKAYAALRQPQK